MTDNGTESVFLLKVKDLYGPEFAFVLGEPEDFNSDMEETCAGLINDICEMVGLEDADD